MSNFMERIQDLQRDGDVLSEGRLEKVRLIDKSFPFTSSAD